MSGETNQMPAAPPPAIQPPTRPSLRSQKGQFASRLWNDTSGVILPYVTLLITVIVGVSVLALDGARYESLQTQLQKGADSLALAGAAELNRLPALASVTGSDSISRAKAAICGNTGGSGACSGISTSATLVSNASIFGSGSSANVQVQSITFYSGLPAGTTATIPSSYQTTDPTQARFVQVVVQPIQISTILPASFFGGSNNVSAQASAVAGNDTTLCNTVPLFTCNPYEQSGDSYATATQRLITALSSSTELRKLILLQGTQGNSGQYYPGNFGYLQPSTGSLPSGTCGPSGGGVVQAMALSTVNACTNQNSVSTQTGNDQNVFRGLDVRFDLWIASFNHCSTDSNYAPDVNVRKGYVPGNGAHGACNAAIASGATWPPGATGANSLATGLPLDNNMYGNGIVVTSPNPVTTGDGNWTCGDLGNLTVSSDVYSTSGNGANATSQSVLTVTSTDGILLGMGVKSTNLGSNSPSGAQVTNVSDSAKTVTISPGAQNISQVTFAGYWSTAHAGDTAALANPPPGCTAPATTSRNAVYQYEIDHTYSSDFAGGNSSGEQGSGAMCSTTTPAPGRRILHVAMLNCLSLSIQGHATNVPVAAYAKMFLTVPVDNNVNDPYVEITGLDTPGDGFQFQTVQLYR